MSTQPGEAQVILIHGTNGMGKTSVLSALELALTGSIAHLASDSEAYKKYLTTLGKNSGSISLTTTASYKPDALTQGIASFAEASFSTTPLLDLVDRRFFSERSYLPQATLGRLLEIYGEQTTDTVSPFTKFVKELLGIEPLDALVDGLNPAFDIRRIRNLVPEYRHLDGLKTSLEAELARTIQAISVAEALAETKKTVVLSILGKLGYDFGNINDKAQMPIVRRSVQDSSHEIDSLAALERVRIDLKATIANWKSLPPEESVREQATKEQENQIARKALTGWMSAEGGELQKILSELNSVFPGIPSFDNGPEKARVIAEARATAEAARCNALLVKSVEAEGRLAVIRQTIQNTNARIGELDQALSQSAENVQSLAGALAVVAPHVHSDICPVCDRDFGEQKTGPLSAHIAAKLARLTNEAGKLQAIATERAEESNRLVIAQRDLLSVQQEQMPESDQAELTLQMEQMSIFVQRLRALSSEAEVGETLLSRASSAREAASLARRTTELSSVLLSDIDRLVTNILDAPINTFTNVDEALRNAEFTLDEKVREAEMLASARVEALSTLDDCMKRFLDVEHLQSVRHETQTRLSVVNEALGRANVSRELAKNVANTAQSVRSSIVRRVFNTSLNKVWRDLFVRLAPSEDFVPMFKLPEQDNRKVEAVLETIHRSGRSSGTPAAMLSQGNLNTAALTLFLALHLSVPERMPWILLDDPVQSMDDVHIAQFAALLRSLSKQLDRQLVVAVHERALFDYLTLELSPAFPGDSLITVELTRNFDGDAVGMPQVFSFEDDQFVVA